MINNFSDIRKYFIKIVPIGLVLGIFFAWVVWGGPLERLQEKENKSYPFAPKCKEKKFSGIIRNKSRSFFYRATLLIDLTNGNNLSIHTYNYNNNNKPAKLIDFLQKGDSICKPANSDSMYVYRSGKQYYFILGKDIN